MGSIKTKWISCGPVLLAISALLSGLVSAQDLVTNKVKPSINAFSLESKPTIDGDIVNDPAWAAVTPATGFTQQQPVEGLPATQKTEVYMAFSETALYIGVIAYDDEPSRIVVADSRRDSDLEETDSFQVVIDGFSDRQNGFVFGTNPVGIQYDGQVVNEGAGGGFGSGGGAFNLNWDAPWIVKSKIGDYGWSAEMEIPFSSLRYNGRGDKDWGINFQRNIRRNNEITYWSPIERQFNLYRVSEAGSVSGIQAPAQRGLLVTPYVLTRAEQGGAIVSGTEVEEEFGFDMKYSITPSLTLDATYNTDFAQVEVDDIQVNLDRFSLFFPEKRPFFLENAGQFSVGNARELELFFSRRIGVGAGGTPLPVDGGARLTGKVGDNTNVGFLAMRSEGIDGVIPQNDYTVARVNQELGNRSTVGFMYVGRDGDGTANNNSGSDYNRTYSVDGRWGIGDTTLISGFAAKTETPGRNGDDHAVGINAAYNTVDWTINGGYAEVAEDFNPEVGFLSRTAYRKFNLTALRRYRPANNWLNLFELRPHISYRGYWDFDGFQETGFIHIDNHWEFLGGMEAHTGVNFTLEGVKQPFQIVSGVTVPAGEYEHEEAQLVYFTNQGLPLSINVSSRIGGFFGGDRFNIEPTIRYRVGETFSTELSWNHQQIDLPVAGGDFDVNLARLRLSYSFTPNVLLQALVQYNERDDVIGTNIRFSWLQSANAGLYLVYNQVDESGLATPQGGQLREDARGLIIKYSRIFDFF
ncbi:MAG: hypothetical protein ACI95C_001157 [Pseudohongiellaceae bacterium]|jgi:hypothetical protein